MTQGSVGPRGSWGGRRIVPYASHFANTMLNDSVNSAENITEREVLASFIILDLLEEREALVRALNEANRV